MAKTTCRDCNRTVVMADVGGTLVATDPELISVVTAKQSHPAGGDLPRIRMSTAQTIARRVHAERCSDYQAQARKDRLAAEMRAFTKRQNAPAAAPARRNRGL